MSDIELYDYELPRERIAQEPLATRSDARLMLVDRKHQSIDHYYVRDLPELLTADDTLVLNNTRVIPARLVGYRTDTGGRWQGLFLQADAATGAWEVLTKTRGSLKSGETLTIQDREGRDGMLLVVVSRTDEGHLIVTPRMRAGDASLPPTEPADWLEQYGRIPLPPYIRDGHMVDADVENYQTVFADRRGSVAAPTAGLHFTQPLLKHIRDGATEIAEVTLHVGIGTFRPIAVDRLEDHTMHSEWGSIDAATANTINERREHGRCIAVGTTSVRVLESAAAGNHGGLNAWTGSTDLFIKPPYDFKAVDALMTNFHLPRSSLLVLASAFAGRDLIMEAYQIAIREEYRFFSYGDAMLIV
ncbi:tRNA preQ1(34) S-adenosylmethionine ribosyltransferase-isomerase QueA [Novipirellula artificiosorum]|uniref:S-adenosylmethionine:tRNA ribosyltransferase-isomerase n=1 Tax=Novipirellula artificiosorum TaxID=2528016 RepID=A0A5C6DE14_9BACT|nr:tRNA preQ1(34) S-adenosylmethionine ribosyltransferase-isomerase QueA [Novipirellula artificiosorum]TWU34435.1 S-adenosylmethionine:tRNA ribosyltransferase-isomerase [Novipirellula artificiosorum]